MAARTAFENLRVYRLAEEIADLVWEVVVEWTCLDQDTVRKQFNREKNNKPLTTTN